jgi:hypothetical protein
MPSLSSGLLGPFVFLSVLGYYFALCMICIFVCIYLDLDLWSFRGCIIFFCGFHHKLVQCCYLLDSTCIMCMLFVHILLGGAFPKRHRANCGVFAVIHKVPILGRHKWYQSPRFCRYPRVRSACRITLPMVVVVSSVKTILLKCVG